MSSLPVPTEAEEGKIFVAWLRTKGLKFTHVPNETGGSQEAKRRAIRMKQQGTSRGFVDYVVVIPYVGLACVELKRLRGSKTSPEQLEWIEALNTIPNVQAEVCKGAVGAIGFVSRLLGKPLMVDFPARPSDDRDLPF